MGGIQTDPTRARHRSVVTPLSLSLTVCVSLAVSVAHTLSRIVARIICAPVVVFLRGVHGHVGVGATREGVEVPARHDGLQRRGDDLGMGRVPMRRTTRGGQDATRGVGLVVHVRGERSTAVCGAAQLVHARRGCKTKTFLVCDSLVVLDLMVASLAWARLLCAVRPVLPACACT